MIALLIALTTATLNAAPGHGLARGVTVFGINVAQNEPPRTNPADRLADFGRIPMARGPFYGLDALPSAFDTASAKRIAPELRLQMSFKRLPRRIPKRNDSQTRLASTGVLSLGPCVVVCGW